jgi:hypothetical protein
VDFDNLIRRLQAYRKVEEDAHHRCHLDLSSKRETTTGTKA